MTSPVEGNEVFGILTVQYTYRFIGKARAGEGRYDMTKLEDVKKAYVDHSRRRAQSAVTRPTTQIDTAGETQPQTSDASSQGVASANGITFNI